MSDKQSLEELTQKYLDQIASVAELAELERRLISNHESAAAFARASWFDTLIEFHFTDRQKAEDIEAIFAFGGAAAVVSPLSRSPVLGFLGNSARLTREYFSQPGPLSVLVAAIFMVCMISVLSILPAPTYTPTHIGSNNTTSGTTSSTGFQPVEEKGNLNLVARITGKHNCRWSADGRAPLSYDHLKIGRELKLDSGLLEITYYNGAKLVLEGPVEFTVEKPNACRLEVGKLAAKVSKRAVGFTVETPTTTIVDLGTEFGVEVEQGGTADVRVFKGVVNMTGQLGRSRRITAGQSARLNSSGRFVTPKQTKTQFVRNFPKPPEMVVVSFQQNVDSYAGTADAYLSETNPDFTYGSEVTVTIDGRDNSGNRVEGLLRFDIFGSGAGQVPLGSTIISATLTLTTDIDGNSRGDGAKFHRLLQSWNESSVTWNNSFGGNGIDTTEGNTEAISSCDLDTGYMVEGTHTFTMATTSLQAWSDGAANYGWAMLPPNGDDAWVIDSSEATMVARYTPKLTVMYIAPKPSQDFSDANP